MMTEHYYHILDELWKLEGTTTSYSALYSKNNKGPHSPHLLFTRTLAHSSSWVEQKDDQIT